MVWSAAVSYTHLDVYKRQLPGRLEFGGEGTDALATADPPVHKMHRDVVFSELVAKRMATLEEPIAELADVRIDGAIAKGTVDLSLIHISLAAGRSRGRRGDRG